MSMKKYGTGFRISMGSDSMLANRCMSRFSVLLKMKRRGNPYLVTIELLSMIVIALANERMTSDKPMTDFIVVFENESTNFLI
jgi:hypothetical protein